MSIKQKTQDDKLQRQVRRDMEKALEQFCCKMKLNTGKRDEIIDFVIFRIEERDNLAKTLSFNSPSAALSDAEMRQMVVEYLTHFSEEMDELVVELTAISKEAKDEIAMLCASE
jgi:hypothetical protein